MFDNRKLQSSYNHISSPTSRHNRIILGLILFTGLQGFFFLESDEILAVKHAIWRWQNV